MSTYGYLSHHGVKDMTWGVQNGPPYPLDPNPRKQKEKKKIAARRSSLSAKIKKRRKLKKQQKSPYEKVVVTNRGGGEKKRTEQIEKQANRKDTFRVTADAVYKNRSKYTNNELNDIITRLNYEQRLIELSAPKKTRGQKWVEDVFSDSSKKLVISAINKTGNAIIDKALVESGLKEKNDKKDKKDKKKDKKEEKQAFFLSDRS